MRPRPYFKLGPNATQKDELRCQHHALLKTLTPPVHETWKRTVCTRVCVYVPEWVGGAPRFHSKTSAGCPRSLEVQSPPLLHHSASALWEDTHSSDKGEKWALHLSGAPARITLTEFAQQKTERACHPSLCRPRSGVAINLKGNLRHSVRNGSFFLHQTSEREKQNKATLIFNYSICQTLTCWKMAEVGFRSQSHWLGKWIIASHQEASRRRQQQLRLLRQRLSINDWSLTSASRRYVACVSFNSGEQSEEPHFWDEEVPLLHLVSFFTLSIRESCQPVADIAAFLCFTKWKQMCPPSLGTSSVFWIFHTRAICSHERSTAGVLAWTGKQMCPLKCLYCRVNEGFRSW